MMWHAGYSIFSFQIAACRVYGRHSHASETLGMPDGWRGGGTPPRPAAHAVTPVEIPRGITLGSPVEGKKEGEGGCVCRGGKAAQSLQLHPVLQDTFITAI